MKKMTKAEKKAFLEQMQVNIDRTRALAEKGLADLERRKQQRESGR